MVTAVAGSRPKSKLTQNQIRGFLAAWGGWALDGMDAFIYALVLVPALTELLPARGSRHAGQHRLLRQHPVRAVPLRVGHVHGVGPIGDRIGRVRALMLTILCYSVFTFLCGFVTNIWQLAVLRVLVRHRHRRRTAGRRGLPRRGIAERIGARWPPG